MTLFKVTWTTDNKFQSSDTAYNLTGERMLKFVEEIKTAHPPVALESIKIAIDLVSR